MVKLMSEFPLKKSIIEQMSGEVKDFYVRKSKEKIASILKCDEYQVYTQLVIVS